MVRLVLGFLKGGVVGGAIGFAAWKLGLEGGAMGFAVYALVGALVGVAAGKALWRQETLWTPLLKGIFGGLVAMGLYWGARKLLGGMHLGVATRLGAPDQPLVNVPFLLGPLIGGVWGSLVELDDSSGSDETTGGKPPAPIAPRR